MDIKRGGRLLVALILVGIAAYCAWSFVTMPYEMVATTTTRAQPEGMGVFVLAILAGAGALVAVFSGDWG
jgi:hypothetical protein